MGARHLVVGWDGADLDLIRELSASALPTIFRLMERGVFGASQSVFPPATLPNWTSFLTALDPGRHGVFDFTSRSGYRVAFTGGTIRESPTWLRSLDRMGQRVACLSFPATWPPEKLEHGLFMSGWDSPVAFRADEGFVWPAHWYEKIVGRFGTPTFDDVDEFRADAPGWLEALAPALSQRIERKTELCQWLLSEQDWDLFAVYFGESDTASHYLWPLHDPCSPRRPDAWNESAPMDSGVDSPLAHVYRALDRSLGALLQTCGEEVNVTVISDHGSGGASDKVVYLNRILEQAGLLSFRKRSTARSVHVAKNLALSLPPRVREWAFAALGRAAPGWLESHARFGSIDMDRTLAFSDEINYFPAIHLNLRGREPRGQVLPQQVAEVSARIEAALLGARDPWTGEPIALRLVPSEDLFSGPFAGRAPDFAVELALDRIGKRSYSYNLMPSNGPGPITRRLHDGERLGKKGRSLPGAHRPHGFWCASGPAFAAAGEQDLHILDAAATLLASLNVSHRVEYDGRILEHCLTHPPSHPIDTGSSTHGAGAKKDAPPAAKEAHPAEASRIMEKRLRALGYID